MVRGVAGQDPAHDGQPVLLHSGADHELLEIGPFVLAVAVADVEVAVGLTVICSLHRDGCGIEMAGEDVQVVLLEHGQATGADQALPVNLRQLVQGVAAGVIV